VDDAYDYLGRSYLHVPQDVETDLRTDEPPDKCYAPKKLAHSWYEWDSGWGPNMASPGWPNQTLYPHTFSCVRVAPKER